MQASGAACGRARAWSGLISWMAAMGCQEDPSSRCDAPECCSAGACTTTDGTTDAGSETAAAGTSSTSTAGADETSTEDTGTVEPPMGIRWDFEAEALGGDAVDGPLAEGGEVEGTLRWIEGQQGGTVAARGRDGIVVLADASDVDFGADDSFRVELTFRTARHGQGGAVGAGMLVTRGEPAGNGLGVLVRDGRLVFQVWTEGSASEVVSTTLVSDDRWHQATAVRDREAGELRLVVDGHDVASAPDGSGDIRSEAPLRLLGLGEAERFWGGLDSLAVLPGRVDVPVPTPAHDDRVVFAAGDDSADGFDYVGFRIPAIVRTDDGTLVAFAEGRVDDTCDFGRIHVVSKRSTDGGDTWSPLQIVATLGSGKAGNPIPIADGNRIALMVLETPCTSGTGCTCSGEQQHSIYLSDDQGQTWSAREEITDDVTEPGWGGVLLGPGAGLRLARGPSAGTLVVTAKHGGSAHLLASSDHGETWTIAAEESTSPWPINETTAAELSDGRILVNARLQRSLAQEEMEQEEGFRLLGHVGTDWQYSDEPTFSRTNRFHGSVVHGAMLYREGSERFGDEARLLFAYPAGEHGTNAGRRHDMRIYASRDDGQTWSRGRRLHGGWAAYSSLVELADGRVGLLYEGGVEPGPTFEAYRRLQLARTRPEWIDEASLVTYAFESLAPGATPASLPGAGSPELELQAEGRPSTVEGEHHSTAVRFEGGAHACTDSNPQGLGFGRRDGFAIEVTFRTTAHGSGGATESGALVSKTGVGTTPAWWLRVEDGQVRFLMSQCPGEQINCGLVTGACDTLTACENAGVTGGPAVDDGAWHHVRVVRDAEDEQLVLELDGEVVAESPASALGIVTNDEPLCIGAFAGGSRAFTGEIDDVRIELR